MNRFLLHIAFLLGLATVVWVGAGYIGSNPLALAVTVLIAAFYVLGGLELFRFRQATATLAHAVDGLSAPPAQLGPWLGSLHPSLQNAVRLRVEGERVGLPGPALTPYLTGLLVLLGMLGTFLGMVVTLNGTGLALDGATDLDAIRASLSAPVRGLGLAFGTSVAGVAASAMLGLLTTLCRRERLQAAQGLDTRIATTLRPFSLAHQREESFKLLQRQADVLPDVVQRLQALMATMEQQSQALNERLVAGQDRFHAQAEATYTGLAASMDRSLKESLTEGARVAGAAIQPVVEATMAGIARETTTLHDTLAKTVQQQLDGLNTRMEAGTGAVAALWKTALAEHQRRGEALSQHLGHTLGRFADTFEQRSAALVDSVAARLDHTAERVSEHWRGALVQHEGVSQTLAKDTQQALTAAAGTFEEHAASLLRTLDQAQADAHAALAARDEQRLAAWTTSLDGIATTLRNEWQQAGAHTAAQQDAICKTLAQTAHDIATHTEAQARGTLAEIATLVQAAAEAPRASAELMAGLRQQLSDSLARDTTLLDERRRILEGAAASFEQHAASLLRTVDQAHADGQATLAARDEQRLATWTQSLGAMAASLREEWQQAGAQTAAQQQEICKTLAQTAHDMSAQAKAHAEGTLAEIERLVQAAAEAPRAAAEVIGELRQKLTDGMARDNTMLEERSRLLETLGTLLDAVNHASTEQRGAIDALVSTSADLLDRVGTRFTEQIDSHTAQMATSAAQVTGSAVEVASLGEAFGFGVQLFSQSNEQLVAQLQRIEAALGKSLARSDEQLAYYVAQAREVIDLSIMSQKQIVEDLQQFASTRSVPAAETHAATAGSDA